MSETFKGRTALVFGGAKGIGKAVILEWARRGASVAIADIDAAAAQNTADEVKANGGQAIALAADVSSRDSIASAIAQTEAAFGDIDILMNNVGIIINGHPEDLPPSEWDRVTELNYFGSIRAIEMLLPKMLARKSGFIVNTASFAGLYPYAVSRIPYAGAKAAILKASELLAIYLEPQGIRVSCLIPGPVATEIATSMKDWTPGCPMRGPGAELKMMLPGQVAQVLTDGMESGRILIPSDDAVWDIVQRWAADPDAFLRSKMDEFSRGEMGKPHVPEDVMSILMGKK